MIYTPNNKASAPNGGRDCVRFWLEYGAYTTKLIIMNIEIEVEEDGRFIAEVTEIPGAMVYGATAKEAIMKVEALVLRILADRIESGVESPELAEVFTVSA